LVFALVLIWAVRLTANWALSWRGLGHEDWRYVQIREQLPRRVPWWLVSPPESN
jgi:steroid 5-alpha reductase family enzyme